MKLLSRLTWIGSASALVFLTAPPSFATVVSGFGTLAGAAQIYSPQGFILNSVSPGQPQFMPGWLASPAAVVSPPSYVSQPSYNEYDFVSNPQLGAPSAYSLPSVLSTPMNPVSYPPSSLAPSSPVSLLYTGPQAGYFGPGGVPILFNAPSVLPQSNSSTVVAGLFSASDPVASSPRVTAAVANSAPRAVPAFSPVPEPRFVSAFVLAAALALGILVARRRQKAA